MIAQRTYCRAAARPASSVGRAPLVVRCSGNGSSSGAFHDGQIVRVTSSIKVYHAAKHHDGLDLKGMTGTFLKDISHYKGKVLSANLPYFVEFTIPDEPKPIKFKAHLSEEELEAA